MSDFVQTGFIVFGCIASLLILFIVLANRSEGDGWFVSGVVICVFAVVIFPIVWFGAIGGSQETFKVSKIETDVFKSKTRAYIEYTYNGKLESIICTDKFQYDGVSDTTQFYLIEYYSYYKSFHSYEVTSINKNKLDTLLLYENFQK